MWGEIFSSDFSPLYIGFNPQILVLVTLKGRASLLFSPIIGVYYLCGENKTRCYDYNQFI